MLSRSGEAGGRGGLPVAHKGGVGSGLPAAAAGISRQWGPTLGVR